MEPKLALTFSSLLLLAHIIQFAISDGTCQYPCYPPPTGTGTGTPTTGTPPPPASYPPPAGYYPSPTGNLPIYPPPPPFGGGSSLAPPPPDPILPYFPFYFKEPVHGNDVSSLRSGDRRSTLAVVVSTAACLFVF